MNWFVRHAVVAAAASLVLLAGCSDGSVPTAPRLLATSAPLPASAASGARDGALARYTRQWSRSERKVRAWIGAEGGRVELQGFAIEVPPGAVERRTQFTIRIPNDPRGAGGVAAEFGPHNVTFATEVAIELPYAGTTAFGGEGTIGWWDAGGASWVALPTMVTADGMRIRTLTDHFSVFGSMAVFSGTLTASGG